MGRCRRTAKRQGPKCRSPKKSVATCANPRPKSNSAEGRESEHAQGQLDLLPRRGPGPQSGQGSPRPKPARRTPARPKYGTPRMAHTKSAALAPRFLNPPPGADHDGFSRRVRAAGLPGRRPACCPWGRRPWRHRRPRRRRRRRRKRRHGEAR